MTTDGVANPELRERRTNAGLRQLVDEMLAQVRLVAGQESWTAEERERAQRDLERIMASVRQRAVEDRPREASA